MAIHLYEAILASGSFPGFEGEGFYVAEEKRDSVAVVYIPRGLKGKKV